MEENMNNNSVSNNNYEPQKNNSSVKGLLILLIILVLCLIGLTFYKMFIYDKDNNKPKGNNTVVDNGNANNNKEENNNTNNNKENNTVVDNGNTNNNKEESDDENTSEDTVAQFLKSKNIDAIEMRTFSNYTPVYESKSPEKSEDIYKNAMENLKSTIIKEYGEDIKYNVYKFNNCYILDAIEVDDPTGPEYPGIMLLDSEFKVIKSTNRIFYTENAIYYADMVCDLYVDNVPENVKNESHIVNGMYKLDTSTGKNSFMGYVKYTGSTAC